MPAEESRPPSDDELIAFAGKLLGSLGADLDDADLLRETVSDARRLWLLLYQAHHGGEPQP